MAVIIDFTEERLSRMSTFERMCEVDRQTKKIVRDLGSLDRAINDPSVKGLTKPKQKRPALFTIALASFVVAGIALVIKNR